MWHIQPLPGDKALSQPLHLRSMPRTDLANPIRRLHGRAATARSDWEAASRTTSRQPILVSSSRVSVDRVRFKGARAARAAGPHQALGGFWILILFLPPIDSLIYVGGIGPSQKQDRYTGARRKELYTSRPGIIARFGRPAYVQP